jgi:hypothetical protein
MASCGIPVAAPTDVDYMEMTWTDLAHKRVEMEEKPEEKRQWEC